MTTKSYGIIGVTLAGLALLAGLVGDRSHLGVLYRRIRTQASFQQASATAQPIVTLHWDWRKSHTKNDTHWPGEVGDDIWFIEYRTRIIIDLPGNQQLDMTVEHAHVTRNGDSVAGALFLFPIETRPQAYARAAKLIKDWNLKSQADLDAWYKIPEQQSLLQKQPHFGEPERRAVATGVQVGNSYSMDFPWCVGFEIGIDDKIFAPKDPKVEKEKLDKVLATDIGEYRAETGQTNRPGHYTITTVWLNAEGHAELDELMPCDTSPTKMLFYDAWGQWIRDGETITINITGYRGKYGPIGDLQKTITLKRADGGRKLERDNGPAFERHLEDLHKYGPADE